jgi:hypothetical protein
MDTLINQPSPGSAALFLEIVLDPCPAMPRYPLLIKNLITGINVAFGWGPVVLSVRRLHQEVLNGRIPPEEDKSGGTDQLLGHVDL